VPETSRQTLLQVLDKLYMAGVVEKFGAGKFRWKLKVDSWDRLRPFRKQADPTATANVQHAASVNASVQAAIDSSNAKIVALEKELAALKAVEGKTIHHLEVKRWDGTSVTLKDVVLPSVFPQVLALASCRRNILLVGPAGCGKSHLAELVSKTLNLRFGSISCTSGMGEAHLLGRAVPDLTHGKNRFMGTDFLTCYEEGGVFLFDELDAADANLLLAVNTALANGYCNVPNRADKPRATMHPDFIPIATANTFGRGASRTYSGRNQLDEATLDRFRIGTVECVYEEAVERALCPDVSLRSRLTRIRERIESTGLRRVMSTRFMRDAQVMVSGAGWTVQQCVEVFFQGWTAEEKAKVA